VRFGARLATIAGVRIVLYALAGLLLVLQYPLWFGSGGILNAWQLRHEISGQQSENARLRERNQTLEAEVADLKSGHDALEERARRELGMVKKGESFYQVIERPAR
jgi:cell division protein FtsB